MDLRGKGILNVFEVSAEAAKKGLVSMKQRQTISGREMTEGRKLQVCPS